MAAGVTEVTIRNRYKEICQQLNIDAENPQAP
jgi:transcription initiation factor TFIIIB Brf1 subunit/transcription initiation factor TFIIB